MRKKARLCAAVFSALTAILCVTMGFFSLVLPSKFYLSGEKLELKATPYISVSASGTAVAASKSLAPIEAELKLFGVFPLKTVSVQRIDRPAVVPCGTPFGIKILTAGVTVTDFGKITSADGCYSPAENGGIKKGDTITEINGKKIESISDIGKALELNPDCATVNVCRCGENLTYEIVPVRSKNDNTFRLGLWVKDSTAGIGTMTYYDPLSGCFGGLGHAVCDSESGEILGVRSGAAVAVSITDVQRGAPGAPGELCGSFMSSIPIGEITANTEAGLFGTANYAPTVSDAIPLAYKQEVTEGRATVLTTISGMSPKEYEIVIEHIDYDEESLVKNMVVKITDPELLAKSGGIVQGMSGSPIIQNGKLIGAITHVFVGDSTRGYAIFAENMYRTAQQQSSDLPAA